MTFFKLARLKQVIWWVSWADWWGSWDTNDTRIILISHREWGFELASCNGSKLVLSSVSSENRMVKQSYFAGDLFGMVVCDPFKGIVGDLLTESKVTAWITGVIFFHVCRFGFWSETVFDSLHFHDGFYQHRESQTKTESGRRYLLEGFWKSRIIINNMMTIICWFRRISAPILERFTWNPSKKWTSPNNQGMGATGQNCVLLFRQTQHFFLGLKSRNVSISKQRNKKVSKLHMRLNSLINGQRYRKRMWEESRALNFKGKTWGNLNVFNSHDSLMSLLLRGTWPSRHVRDTVHSKDVQNRVNITTKTSSKHPTHISIKKCISQKKQSTNLQKSIHPSCWLVLFSWIPKQKNHPKRNPMGCGSSGLRPFAEAFELQEVVGKVPMLRWVWVWMGLGYTSKVQ